MSIASRSARLGRAVSNSPSDELAARFLAEVAANGARGLVPNAPVEMGSVCIDGHLMPVTVLEPGRRRADSPRAGSHREPSWVVSLRSAYGPYALHEIGTVPQRWARPFLAGVVRTMDASLALAGLDRIVCVNNWLLSTNLYPDWDGSGIEAFTTSICERFPEHFIAFRSLNDRHHPRLLRRLHAAGWDLVPARQVWIAEPGDATTHNRRIDAKLLSRTALVRTSAESFNDVDWSRTADLYAQLYLRKYSHLNPAFTPRFLRFAHEAGFMRVEGVRDAGGTLMAVAGTIASHAVITTPLVGYDCSAPRSLGLYRMAIAMSFEQMERDGRSFNISAGVGGFKRLRGAKPWVEYTALHHRHLPEARRLPLRILNAALQRIAVPFMESNDL